MPADILPITIGKRRAGGGHKAKLLVVALPGAGTAFDDPDIEACGHEIAYSAFDAFERIICRTPDLVLILDGAPAANAVHLAAALAEMPLTRGIATAIVTLGAIDGAYSSSSSDSRAGMA